MRKLACDPTTHASRPTGDDSDSAFKSSHLSEDYDVFPFFEAVSEALAPVKSRRVELTDLSVHLIVMPGLSMGTMADPSPLP